MIVRLADSLGWDVPDWERLQQRAPAMLEGGYALGSRAAALRLVHRLVLLRHGSRARPIRRSTDREQPSSPPTRQRDAKRIAEHLVRLGIAPSSSCAPPPAAPRDARAVEPAIGAATLRLEDEIYGAWPGRSSNGSHAVPETVASVMLIGARPGLEDLALELASAGTDRALETKLPTAALATLTIATATSERLSPGTPSSPRMSSRSSSAERRSASSLVRSADSKWRFDLGTRAPLFAFRRYRAWFLSQVVSTSGVFAQAVGVAWLVLQLGGNAIDLALVSAATFAPVFFGGVWAGRARRPGRPAPAAARDRSRCSCSWRSACRRQRHRRRAALDPLRLSFAAGCVLAVDGPARQVYPLDLVGPAGGQRRRPVRGRPERVAGVRPRAGRAAHRHDRRLGVLRRDRRVVPLPDRRPPPLPADTQGRRGGNERRPGPCSGRPELRAEVTGDPRDDADGDRLRDDLQRGRDPAAPRNPGLPPRPERVRRDVRGLRVGAVGGALLAAGGGSWPTGRRVRLLALLTGVDIVLTGFAPDAAAAFLGLALAGLLSIWFIALANTLVQVRTAPSLRGRVMGIWTMAIPGMNPSTGLLAGVTAVVLGPRAASRSAASRCSSRRRSAGARSQTAVTTTRLGEPAPVPHQIPPRELVLLAPRLDLVRREPQVDVLGGERARVESRRPRVRVLELRRRSRSRPPRPAPRPSRRHGSARARRAPGRRGSGSGRCGSSARSRP